MAKRIPYYDELLEAFGQAGCPVCRVLAVEADRLVDAILFEMVNDVRVRQELNEAGGYCGRHAQMLVRPGGALGSATMMQGVIKHLLRALDEAPADGGGNRLRGLLGGSGRARAAEALAARRPCPVCANEATLLSHYTTTLLAHLKPDSPLAAAYLRSDGLCLAHVRHALGEAGGGPAVATLVDCQRTVWERLNGELEEFLRKNDYRFSHEPMGAERDSWLRAIAAISGPLPEHLTRP